MNPLNSIAGSIVTGVIVAILIVLAVTALGAAPLVYNEPTLARWLHIISGVMWIGLLYYFNVVQTPALSRAAADIAGPGGAAVTKYVAPLALLWFRWAAVSTWLTGFWYLTYTHQFMNALTLGGSAHDYYGLVIGTGMWLGTIMLFNVWVLIWPNQKKILGIVPASDPQKARARKVALLTSRTNFALSIPMLMCMASAFHRLPF